MIVELEQAIWMADHNSSKLTARQLNVEGMTGVKVRHLLNRLGDMSTNCLEIGSFQGAMTVATNYGNHLNYFVCDNWSQFNGAEKNRESFYGNINLHHIKCTVLEQDCFTIDLKKLPKIDLYIFDGDHNVDAQTKAITYFKPILAERFILVVDDYSWWQSKEGTEAGLEQEGMQVLFSRELGVGIEGDAEGWWNGLFVALIQNK